MNSPEDALMSVAAAYHWLEAAALDVEGASASLATLEVDLRAIPGPGVVTIPSAVAVQREIILLQARLVSAVSEIEKRCPPETGKSDQTPLARSDPGQLAVRKVRTLLADRAGRPMSQASRLWRL